MTLVYLPSWHYDTSVKSSVHESVLRAKTFFYTVAQNPSQNLKLGRLNTRFQLHFDIFVPGKIYVINYTLAAQLTNVIGIYIVVIDKPQPQVACKLFHFRSFFHWLFKHHVIGNGLIYMQAEEVY